MPISVTPASTVNLVKVPLENDYKNTFTFSSLENQTNYFNGLSSRLIAGTDYTYVKKDNKIRVGIPIDDIINYNYLFYTNNGFPKAKRYYCFITRMEYVNENATDIFIQTDVFQTWYFQLVWNRCFVEREHVNNDGIGLNTYPEGLETGEYVGNGDRLYDAELTQLAFVVSATNSAVAPTEWIYGQIGGIPNAGRFYITDDADDFSEYVIRYASSGRLEAVKNCYVTPKRLWGNHDWSSSGDTGGTNEPSVWEDSVDMPRSLNGYTPHNNKLLCYPYQFITLSNNNGSYSNLRYELFTNANNKAIFSIAGVASVGCSIICRPKNYNNYTYNTEVAVLAGKFPTLSWSGDAFTNWLTQNAVNIPANIATGVTETLVGAGLSAVGNTLSGASAISGGLMSIAKTMGEIYQHQLVPQSAFGNINGGDILTSDHTNTFFYDRKSIKAEMAEKIDRYFDMFGYKICNVKVPNITGRQNWNYIKTIDCNVDGDIPQEDLTEVRNACNNGITFWHNPSSIYNYALSNNII